MGEKIQHFRVGPQGLLHVADVLERDDHHPARIITGMHQQEIQVKVCALAIAAFQLGAPFRQGLT